MSIFKTFKLKAGAIQFVIYIVVVIALLLSMFLLYIHLSKQFVSKRNTQIEAIQLSNYGVNWSLDKDLAYKDTIYHEINKQKSFKILKQHWGIFDVVHSFSSVRDKSFIKSCFVGGKTPFDENLGLYLKDNNQALVVAGNTIIEADVYVGQYGVKPGMISGIGYTNDKLVYGNVKRSQYLPKLLSNKKKYIREMLFKPFLNQEDYEYFDIQIPPILEQSFLSNVQYHFSFNNIDLYQKNYNGKIIIQSAKRIYVDSSTELENVILIAPEIEIDKNFKGTLQAFASKNILINENAQLNYPSALILMPKTNISQDNQPQIKIKNLAIVKGCIAFLENSTPNSQNIYSHIEIEENAEVYGQIFCDFNTNLKGKLYGHVITNQFLTPYQSTLYMNHLLDAEITSNPVSKNYSGLLFQSNPKNIALWID